MRSCIGLESSHLITCKEWMKKEVIVQPKKPRERTAAVEKRGKIAQKCTSLLLSFAIEVVVLLPLSY